MNISREGTLQRAGEKALPLLGLLEVTGQQVAVAERIEEEDTQPLSDHLLKLQIIVGKCCSCYKQLPESTAATIEEGDGGRILLLKEKPDLLPQISENEK